MKDEYRDDLPETPADAEQEGENTEPTDLQSEFAKRMKAIASDLWGGIPGAESLLTGLGAQASGREQTGTPAGQPAASTGKAAATNARRPQQATNGKPQQAANRPAGGKTAEKPGKAEKPADDVDIEHLWQQADETVDWTEALSREHSADGLTPEKQWQFYHRMAPGVLAGNLDAYVEVLTTINPLGDLRPYVNGMVIRTPNPDRLECRFECRDELLEEKPKLYLTALSLRIARDLFAVLPVAEVYVEGNLRNVRKLGVVWRRRDLLNRNPVFVDPVALAEQVGAAINL